MIGDRLAERLVRDAFAGWDVQIGGTRPWDLRVRDPAFYRRMAINPSLQLGETFLEGKWECDAVDELVFRVFSTADKRDYQRGWKHHLRSAWARVTNPQSRARATHVAEQHYDQTPELFQQMLDEETMSYTCAFWQEQEKAPLGTAQQNKLRMICEKLKLREGETLLDIGCGFGGLANFAAENYGARVLGITNSRMHLLEARRRSASAKNIELQLLDYRELPKLGRSFDKVAAVEMIEAVGPKNFRPYMQIVHGLLRPGGRFLVQAFISETSEQVCNEWFDRHVFPNGVTPSLEQLAFATSKNFGAPEQVEEMGQHYPPTLLSWNKNLEEAWSRLSKVADERSRRMWRFYLNSLAGTFRAEYLRLCQIVYARSEAA